MLTDADITFMKQSQDEIYALRTRPITFIYVDKQYDDVTGTPVGEIDVPKTVEAVITELSINKANGARYEMQGIEYEQGDIKIDVKIEDVADILEVTKRADFDDKRYEILGGDKKGIGVRNRVEFIGREIT